MSEQVRELSEYIGFMQRLEREILELERKVLSEISGKIRGFALNSLVSGHRLPLYWIKTLSFLLSDFCESMNIKALTTLYIHRDTVQLLENLLAPEEGGLRRPVGDTNQLVKIIISHKTEYALTRKISYASQLMTIISECKSIYLNQPVRSININLAYPPARILSLFLSNIIQSHVFHKPMLNLVIPRHSTYLLGFNSLTDKIEALILLSFLINHPQLDNFIAEINIFNDDQLTPLALIGISALYALKEDKDLNPDLEIGEINPELVGISTPLINTVIPIQLPFAITADSLRSIDPTFIIERIQESIKLQLEQHEKRSITHIDVIMILPHTLADALIQRASPNALRIIANGIRNSLLEPFPNREIGELATRVRIYTQITGLLTPYILLKIGFTRNYVLEELKRELDILNLNEYMSRYSNLLKDIAKKEGGEVKDIFETIINSLNIKKERVRSNG